MTKELNEKHRLNSIRDYLGIKADIANEAEFEKEAIAACVTKIANIQDIRSCTTGEDLVARVATSLNVRFEEIKTETDIVEVSKKYLEQNEISFGQLPLVLEDPSVDALLFKRETVPNEYIAVLNLQNTEARAYCNQTHELSHRLAEPPQQRLFYRHHANQKNRVEHIVDLIGAEVGFYQPIFKPVVDMYTASLLNWEIVNKIKDRFAPSSSLMAVTKAIVKYWPLPVFLLYSEYKGRKNNALDAQALRAAILDWNSHAKNSGLFFFPNMRVPKSSPIYETFFSSITNEDFENLSNWNTSSGSQLPSRNSFTSARKYHEGVLALISLI
jgi:hypothetical protein